MSPTLEEVTAAFNHWRSNRPKRSKIPHVLTEQAVALIGKHSKAEITRCLNINHGMLNRWLGLKPEPSDFIALPAVPRSIDQLANSALEVKAQLSNGAQITISGSPDQAAMLIGELQQRGRL